MLLHAEHVVTTDQIVDAMWGEAAPRSASTQVRNMLSALRAALHDGTRALATLDREPAGYRLHIATGRLDLAVFTACQRGPGGAVAGNPGRERFVAQLMIALYRGGRTNDALGVYRRARQTLAEEFGLEPGPTLRDLERRILLGDPAAPVEVEASPSPVRADPPVPAQLLLDVRGFAGRHRELDTLNALIGADAGKRPTATTTCTRPTRPPF